LFSSLQIKCIYTQTYTFFPGRTSCSLRCFCMVFE
jgi:hypothetical protein